MKKRVGVAAIANGSMKKQITICRKGVNREQYYVWARILPSAEGQSCSRRRRGSSRLEACSLKVPPSGGPGAGHSPQGHEALAIASGEAGTNLLQPPLVRAVQARLQPSRARRPSLKPLAGSRPLFSPEGTASHIQAAMGVCARPWTCMAYRAP